jgi:ribosomal-protein-alanine N-acetyltransferase
MQVQQLTQENALHIANNWKYAGEYSFYDITADDEDYAEFIDEKRRKENYFEVYENDQLIGFFSIEHNQKEKVIDLGVGMKPEWTGKGKGQPFLESILPFIKQSYEIDTVTLAVATFNKRAITVYERLGFERIEIFTMRTNGGEYEFLSMKKQIK